MTWILNSIVTAVVLLGEMAWDTWWALVLGFTLSGAVEAFVSEQRMVGVLGDDGWREVGLGAVLGAASSSCSYSAVGTTKTLFKKGASAVASLGAFMFASTDLVIELGLVMWVLLGWQFVVGEYVGGLVAVVVIALLFKHVVPVAWIEHARERVRASDETACATCDAELDPTAPDTVSLDADTGIEYFCCSGCRRVFEARSEESTPLRERLLSTAGWQSAARATVKDWEMVWRDIVLGFVIASLVAGFVPKSWWAAIVPAGHGLGGVALATGVAILIGVVTFMCSVGNVPFALVLWQNGLPYGAVLSFIYADLLIPPLLRIYRRYYGPRMAATLTAVLAVAAFVAGVTIHYVALGAGLIPPAGEVGGTIPNAYTLVLNLLFTPVFLAQVLVTHGADSIRRQVAGMLRQAGRSVHVSVTAAGGVLTVLAVVVAAAIGAAIDVVAGNGATGPTPWRNRAIQTVGSVAARARGAERRLSASGQRLVTRLDSPRDPADSESDEVDT